MVLHDFRCGPEKRRLSSCGAFGANYLRGENSSEGFFHRSCNLGKSFPYASRFKNWSRILDAITSTNLPKVHLYPGPKVKKLDKFSLFRGFLLSPISGFSGESWLRRFSFLCLAQRWKVWMFKASHPEVRLHRQCRRLMLRLYLPEKTADDSVQQKNAEYVVSRSSYVCLNWGVRRNDRQGLINHFEELIKPFLDTQQFDKLIWRTSLPQHFKGKDGSGLFESRHRDSAPSCGPVTDRVANNWRNTLFTKWLRSHLGSTAHKLYQIDVNDYFLERHDLHSTGDCTHYLYSPFAYFHLWEAIVQILKIWNCRRTSLMSQFGWTKDSSSGLHVHHTDSSTTFVCRRAVRAREVSMSVLYFIIIWFIFIPLLHEKVNSLTWTFEYKLILI